MEISNEFISTEAFKNFLYIMYIYKWYKIGGSLALLYWEQGNFKKSSAWETR